MRDGHSLFWPLGVVVVGIALVSGLLSAPLGQPEAAPLSQDEQYTEPTATPTTAYPEAQTQTTEAEETTDTPTSASEEEDEETVQSNQADEPTSTPSPAPTPTARPTDQPTATVTPLPSTPTPTPDDGIEDCIAGVPLLIVGEGAPPMSSLVISFGRYERELREYVYVPVGGGISNSEGGYRLQLVVGEEEPGYYPVQVEVRESHELVERFTCNVLEQSDITPTAPTPPAASTATPTLTGK